MKAPRHHFFVCTNRRRGDGSIPGCGEGGGGELAEALRAQRMQRGMAAQVYVTESACLGLCPARGATVVVYPEGVWYSEATAGDAAEIAAAHLDGKGPVERLRSKLIDPS